MIVRSVQRRALSPLARFILAVLAWLPATFAIWYFAAPILLWPAALIAEVVGRTGFADLVRTVEQTGAVVTFTTTLKPGQAIAGGIYQVLTDERMGARDGELVPA